MQRAGRRKTRSDLTAKHEDAIWCEWLTDNWDPEVKVQSQIVIMNRRTHKQHQAMCAGAGKDGKGKLPLPLRSLRHPNAFANAFAVQGPPRRGQTTVWDH